MRPHTGACSESQVTQVLLAQDQGLENFALRELRDRSNRDDEAIAPQEEPRTQRCEVREAGLRPDHSEPGQSVRHVSASDSVPHNLGAQLRGQLP